MVEYYKMKEKVSKILIVILLLSVVSSCNKNSSGSDSIIPHETRNESMTTYSHETDDVEGDTNSYENYDSDGESVAHQYEEGHSNEPSDDAPYTAEFVYLDMSFPYATYSIINDGFAILYKVNENRGDNKNITIAVNAGHGTKGGASLKTFSHPDFSPKVSGGTNAKGEILSTAVSAGTTFTNGMTEANANLVVAALLKEKLLNDGYSVLMIRENDDCRLDNIARTVLANEYADAHIAIHFDSTDTDKGIFYIVPYNDEAYLNMEPLKSNISRIKKLGDSVVESFREMNEKIWKNKGTLQGDLTQLSFSTNASIDIELGDKKTNVTMERAEVFAEGIKKGIDKYFGK